MNKTLSLLLAAALTACGQANDSTSDLNNIASKSDNSASIQEGAFKMYEEARFQPSAFCDVHTTLILKNSDEGIIAHVSNDLDGVCELAVFPNLRTYKLTATSTSCGSTTYSGTIIDGANDNIPTTIEVIDHRRRICRDIVPARIILNEVIAPKHVRTLYSYDMKIAAIKTTSVSGTLLRLYAIGGESTGYGLQLADGKIIELALESAELINSFVDGREAKVTGTYKYIQGVEIPQRQILVVKSMTVL